MKIFDQPDNFPPVLFHVWEYLQTFGPSPIEVVVDRVAYPSDHTLEDPDSPEISSGMKSPEASVRSILKVGQFLNIFGEVSGKSTVSEIFSDKLSYTEFWQKVLCCVLNYGVTGSEDQKKGSLPVAIAWYLTFSLADAPRTWEEARSRLADDFRPPSDGSANRDWIISNDTQWKSFVRWLIILGFARELPIDKGASTILLPDLSKAISATSEREVTDRLSPVSVLVNQIADDIPALHGGSIWNLLPPAAKERSTLYSDVLLAAFHTLAFRGIIFLEEVQDSQHVIPFGPRGSTLDQVRKATQK